MKKTIVVLYTKNMYDVVACDLCNFMAKTYTDCDIIAIDEDRYSNLWSSKFNRNLYIFSARNFAWINKLAVNIREKFLPKKINKTVKPYPAESNEESAGKKFRQKFHKVDNIFMRFNPDIVICLSPKGHNKAILAKQRLDYKFTKVYAYISDFSLNKAYINYQSDGYFVQNENIKQALMANMVEEDKIITCGCVVDKSRLNEPVREEVLKEIGIENNFPVVTISSGRYGVSYLKDAFACLAPYSDRMNIVVLTGGSSSIEKFVLTFAKAKNYNQNIFVINGKCDMNKIYAVTDVIVTSPTTGTMYEVLAKNIPCVLINPLNNLEKGNHTFLAEEQLALRGGREEQMSSAVLGFINNNNIKQEYLYNQRKYFDDKSINKLSEYIYKIGCEVLETKMQKKLIESKQASEVN